MSVYLCVIFGYLLVCAFIETKFVINNFDELYRVAVDKIPIMSLMPILIPIGVVFYVLMSPFTVPFLAYKRTLYFFQDVRNVYRTKYGNKR
jgi:hypothetical protein